MRSRFLVRVAASLICLLPASGLRHRLWPTADAASAQDGLRCRFRPLGAPVSGHDALLAIPKTKPTTPAELHRQADPLPKALVFDRFVRHTEASNETRLAHLIASEKSVQAKYATSLRLAHDGRSVYISAEMRTPPGKTITDKTLTYGVWPGRGKPTPRTYGPLRRPSAAGFDNTEFLAIVLQSGDRASRARWIPRFVWFVDWQGRVIHQQARKPYLSRFQEKSDASGLEALATRGRDRWKLTARLPVGVLLPLVVEKRAAFKLNVARVTGWPEKGIPVRASSLRGTFLAHNAFFSVQLAEKEKPVQAVAFGFGSTTGWLTYARGAHTARVSIHSERDGATRVIHRVLRAGKSADIFDKRVGLKKGLNRFDWPWAVGKDWDKFTNALYVGGKPVTESRSKTSPALILSPCEHVVPADGTLSSNVKFGCLKETLKGMALRIKLSRGKTAARQWVIRKLPETSVDVDIVPREAGLGRGAYRLDVELLDGVTVLGAASHSFEVTTPAPPPIAHPIAIELVDTSEGKLEVPYPVKTGIPFPQGRLRDVNTLAIVDDRGFSVPSFRKALAFWSRDGSIKWLRLEFLRHPGRKYRLKQTGKKAPEVASRVTVTTSADTFRVTSGQVAFSVGRKGFDGLRGMQREGTSYATRIGGFYAIDEAGIRYESRNAPGVTVVEEQTPERVTLKLTGACVSKDGIETLRYVMRITVCAGQPVLEIMPTIIFTCNTKMFRFREIGIDLGLVALPGRGMHFRAQQQSPDRLRIDNGTGWKPLQSKPERIFTFTGKSGCVAVAIRDLRERAPLEIAHTPERGLSVLLWPDMTGYTPKPQQKVSVRDLPRLPFAHQGPLLDFNVPPTYERFVTGRAAGYMRAAVTMGNALGMARTHEFALVFAPTEQEQAKAVARTYLRRPHVAATGKWMADTWAVGDLPMTPQGPANDKDVFGRTETVLDRNFDWEMRKLAPCTPGKWTWGAAHSLWTEKDQRWSIWRLFRNTHHGATKGYWYLFARSADPKYLAFARRATEFVADLGMCHYADTDLRHLRYYGKVVGAVCDYKGYVPWHSGSRFGYNTYADFLINWHYFTGHPRAADVLDELHRFYLRHHRGAATGGRAGASRFESACSLYAHTLDGRLLGYLNRSLATPRRNQSEVGFIPSGREFGTWLPYYINLTSDPVALDMLKRWAYADLKQPWWYDFEGKNWQPNWATQAYAYYCFRDPALLGPGLARLKRHILDGAFLRKGHPEDGHIRGGNSAWCWLQQKIPVFLWALRDAGNAAKPLYAKEALSLMVFEKRWRTFAVFDRADGKPTEDTMEIRFRGPWHAKGRPAMRIIAASGRLLHEGLIPEFSWKRLSLSNPPIYPATGKTVIKLGRAQGPFYLQVRGDGGWVDVMLPLSNMPKEVYEANDTRLKHVTATIRSPGRFPQLAKLQDQRQWFNQVYGYRRMCFFVPKRGRRIYCHLGHFGFGRHAFIISDTSGKRIYSKAGFQRSKRHAERVEGSVLAPLRGKLAVFYEPSQQSNSYLILGPDIPPYVALSPDAFFIPKPLKED